VERGNGFAGKINSGEIKYLSFHAILSNRIARSRFAFATAESTAFLNELMKIGFEEKDIAALENRTEG
jgi:hypothetical protein